MCLDVLAMAQNCHLIMCVFGVLGITEHVSFFFASKHFYFWFPSCIAVLRQQHVIWLRSSLAKIDVHLRSIGDRIDSWSEHWWKLIRIQKICIYTCPSSPAKKDLILTTITNKLEIQTASRPRNEKIVTYKWSHNFIAKK